MNPATNETAGSPSTRPSVEQAAAAAANLAAGSAAVALPLTEHAPAAPEQAPAPIQAPAAAAPALTLPLPPLPVPAAGPPAIVPAPVATPVTPSIMAVADDDDLIEKDWVNKAKQIVEQTRDDPYKQSEELTVFKADYMKKRYDKTIKLNQ